MVTLLDRVVKIMAFMYAHPQAELVINITSEASYLFAGLENQFPLAHDEVACLVRNEIIEVDGGCNDEGHTTEVYVLTDIARRRIKAILDDNSRLLLS